MRFKTLAAGVAFAWCGVPLAQPAPPSHLPRSEVASTAQALTLEQAWQLAEAGNPLIRSRLTQLAAAEGTRADAGSLLSSNPVLTVDPTRRTVALPGGTERRYEPGVGLSQTFEIAGQRGHRRAAAETDLAAVRAEIADARRQVRADVADQFYRVLALQQRIEVESQAQGLFDSTAEAVRKRREAGEDTRLDANVALVEAERARNQLAQVQERLLDARTELAASLQLPASRVPEAVGDLYVKPSVPTLAQLFEASELQPRVQALAAREASATARLRLEQASRYPDVTVGFRVGREGASDARERLTTLSVSVPLPFFKHNAAGVGQATTDLSRAQLDREIAMRDVRARVGALSGKLASVEARVARLQSSVLPALEGNRQLAAKSQRAGQIGLLELIVVNRQSLDARRDLIEAFTEYQSTRIALLLAAGWDQEGTRP